METKENDKDEESKEQEDEERRNAWESRRTGELGSWRIPKAVTVSSVQSN